MRRRAMVMAALSLAAPAPLAPFAGPARAQRAEPPRDTLRVAWRDAVPDLHPYYNTQRTGLVLAHHGWDTLIYRDPDTLQLKPLLATTWRYANDTTLEFELRPGVTFHDGTPFTADDVEYTVQAVLTDPLVAVPSNYAFLAGAEKLDELRVRIRLKRVFPAALEYLSMVLPILPSDTRERLGPNYSFAPVGTGPYRITRAPGAAEVELERFDAYFDGPKTRPAIRRIVVTEVPTAAAEVQALLNGEADWVWDFSPDQLDTINRNPSLQTLRAETMRVAYLNMDAAGRSADSPFRVQKVRQAVAHAIDRPAMARLFMGAGARVLDASCYPTQFGCDQAVAARYPYDPARARALLAEAGLGQGFDTELSGYLLPQWQAAVQGYLAAVGIRATLLQLPVAEAVARSSAGRNALELGSWGSYSINDASAFFPNFFTGGPQDYARDGDVTAAIEAAGTTTDPDQRRAAYRTAIKRISEQAFFLPLFTVVKTYGFSRALGFRAPADELPRFFLAGWR